MDVAIPADYRTTDFWVGYLGSALESSLEGIEKASTRRALREWKTSQAARPEVEVVAFAVVCAQDECYAVRDSLLEAEKARGDATEYLLDAESCGHSLAHGWVAQRLPMSVLGVTSEEREALLDEGTPVLDREP